MKCFLLLAAVYSLIFHQWHKENVKETIGEKNIQEVRSLEPKAKSVKNIIVGNMISDPQFFMLNGFLKMNK